MQTSDFAEEPSSKQRRPYVPPAIEESGSFERLVLACGRTLSDLGDPLCDPEESMMANPFSG